MKKAEGNGYLYILIGMTLWGVLTVVAKSLFIIGLPPAEGSLRQLCFSGSSKKKLPFLPQ